MKEATIVKEYELKFKQHILTATRFPFDIQQFTVTSITITWNYVTIMKILMGF